MKIAHRTVLLVMAVAVGSLLSAADRVPAPSSVPDLPALRDAGPVLEDLALSPEPTAAIVSPTSPTWLAPALLSQTASVPQRRALAKLAVVSSDGTASQGLGNDQRTLAAMGSAGGGLRRLNFVVGPRAWAPSVDLSQPYLMWPDLQADGARARFVSDPTSFWSDEEALRGRVALRSSAVPYLRFSVPVPVEPGSKIQSLPPAPDEPLPARPLEVLSPRTWQP